MGEPRFAKILLHYFREFNHRQQQQKRGFVNVKGPKRKRKKDFWGMKASNVND